MVRLHAVVDLPPDRLEAGTRFWSQALGWPVGEPWPGHPELRSLEPPGAMAYVHVQRVDAAPRVHVDVEAHDRPATEAEAVRLGAEVTSRAQRWVAMRSPGGLPFCVVPAGTQPVPEPVAWPDGHRARLVQVCIDSPRRRHDEEVAFWRALLGGRWVGSGAREFAGRWHDDGSPLQLLFQRLDEADGDVRAHLDLGTDDQAAEVDRLLRLGATDVGPGPGGWHVLTDPTGMVFCATRNPPAGSRDRPLGDGRSVSRAGSSPAGRPTGRSRRR